MQYDIEDLAIIHYPDPRLRMNCARVTKFDDDLAALAERMRELMRDGKGVGLAAPQVGLLIRMFVMNPTGEPDGVMTLVNPLISDRAGSAEREEGCLSLPEVFVQVRRPETCIVTAQTVTGETIEIEAENMIARVAQHETDHLNGKLILDRMGPADKIATRKILQALEENYRKFGRGASGVRA